jgi:ADP-ribose pyrophosphatase
MRKRLVFKTPWFGIEEIYENAAGVQPDGDQSPYYAIARSDGVIGLVLTPTCDVVLARQYRPPLQRHTLEMPAGGIEPGETPEAAVEREVLEEIGFTCERFVYIAACRLMLNRDSAVEHFFCAVGAKPSPDFVPAESIETQLFSRAEFRALVMDGGYEQTVALGGLWLAEQRFGFRFFDDPADAIVAALLRPQAGTA